MMFSVIFPDEDFLFDRDNLANLIIREGPGESGFCYFYDNSGSRIVKHFLLAEGPRVALMCDVVIIKKPEGYSPRISLWKRDKTKPGRPIFRESLSNLDPLNIKARVDTNEGHENFWKLISFLQSFAGITLPQNSFSVVSRTAAELARLFEAQDRHVVLEAVAAALGNTLTEADITLISNRRQALGYFDRLLNDEDFRNQEKQRLGKTEEALWQAFFENHQWIFGYGLKLVSTAALDGERLERYTSGANIFSGAGKRSDAVLRSRGFLSHLVMVEIKTPQTSLISASVYRRPDVYVVDREISGAVAQVQKTARKVVRQLNEQVVRLYEDDGTPTSIVYSTTRPRQVVVAGHLRQLTVDGNPNREKLETLELYRTSLTDTELLTFDELLARAAFIVEG